MADANPNNDSSTVQTVRNIPDELLERDDWKHRRLRMDLVLVFFCGWISYILYQGGQSPVYQTAIMALIGGVIAIIGTYVFGAVWDYKQFTQAVSRFGGRNYGEF